MDLEARTYQFIVVAHPLPRVELDLFQRRAQQLADERDSAQNDLALLRRTAEEQSQRLTALIQEVESLSNREAELRAMLLDTHEELTRREDQSLTAVKERDTIIRELQRQVAEQTAWAQRSLAEVVELQTTLSRIQSSLPAKLYRAARRVARLRPL